ncbi:MBL fold metallo-hydrolase [Marinomonas sp. TI.3.20]|uniref:MBL fold metallo-hydrolase n=1 Tax=Marinomonas sp. TI.3.20 TaxID=3121296 RepID=UPI00311FDA06
MKISIDILSGAGRKTSAAILVTYQSDLFSKPIRFLLDAGGALEANEDKGWIQPKDLDAIFISHDHQDHMGGLIDIDSDVPVFATLAVQKQLPTHLNLKTLPVSGTTSVCGINITTGSAGHSFGGVWLHLDIGDGVFYSGDFSLESTLYPFTFPPMASIALLDASYGLYDESLDQCKNELATYLNDDKHLLMPVPQTGRALEIACWLTSLGFEDWTLGNDCISPKDALSGPKEGIFTNMRPVLERIKKQPFNLSAKAILCGDPDGMGGEAEALLKQPERYLPIYTGHLPEHARQAVSKGDAHFIRWNVHPRRRDLKRLIDHLECHTCAPLFNDIKDLKEWQQALGPSITSNSYIEQNNDINKKTFCVRTSRAEHV